MHLVCLSILASLNKFKRATLACLLVTAFTGSMNAYAESYAGTLNLKNADNKICTAVISEQISKAAPGFISPAQRGFVRGQQDLDNVRGDIMKEVRHDIGRLLDVLTLVFFKCLVRLRYVGDIPSK